MQPLKILELGKFYPPHRGGMEALLKAWAEGFARRGAQVDCVVASDAAASAHETLGGVRVHRLATFGGMWSVSICPGYLLGPRRYRADLWHAHFPNPLADLACWLGNRQTPLVLHYHSDIVRQAGAAWLYAPLLRWILGRAARIVVATPAHVEYSSWLPQWRHKCEIIPFGLDLRRFAPNEQVMAAAADYRKRSGGRLILLHIGRLVGYKGQRYLIQAVQDVDAVVWLVGEGPLRPALAAEARARGVADRVTFWGELDDAQLVTLLHACDVFVLPSVTPNEAFGLVQVEAMACGKPVVSSALRSGVPWVNQDGVTGLVVPPADAVALAQALGRLAADPALRLRLGDGGRRRSQEEFEESIMLDRYWRLFGQVMAERASA